MALAPFFDRVYGSVGGHLGVSRESLTSRLRDVVAGLVIPDEEASYSNSIWIAELVSNLLSRLYPRIAIIAPSHVENRLKRLCLAINPSIEINAEAPSSTSIAVGRPTRDGQIVVGATGWVATLSSAAPLSCVVSNPYAAGAAASLACAFLFRRVFLGRTEEATHSVSLLRYDNLTGDDLPLHDVDLGSLWYAGVGAVGNAGVWCLARDSHIRGEITLIDVEELSLFNLQRYVLGTLQDVGLSKVALAARELRSDRLTVKQFLGSLESIASKGNIPSTIVVSVDNVAGRRAAQALLPRLVLNGFTGESGLGASWHRFSDDAACLACLYHPQGTGLSATEQAARALGLSSERAALLWVTRQPLSNAEIRTAAATLGVSPEVLSPWVGRTIGDLYTDAVCGAVPLDVRGVGQVESVPLAHQSVLAGCMMAAELVKRHSPLLGRLAQTEKLVSYDDILRPPPSAWTKPRAREPGCICGDLDYRNAYERKWG